MANTGVSHVEAKSICDALECSPSQHQPTSPLYVGSRDNPQAMKTQSPKASADKGAEKDMGVKRVPAVSKGENHNRPIKKAT
jgi:hypothetical protein